MNDQLLRTLSGIEIMLARIYNKHDRQYFPSIESMTLKLVGAIGNISSVERKGDSSNVPNIIADCFVWWIAVCNFLDSKVEDVLWYKFPGICPYCGVEEDCDCEGRKDQIRIPETVVQNFRDTGIRPETMADWQAMFERIYGKTNALHGYVFAVARLPEEFAEMVECILPYIEDKQKLMMELADLAARIFALASLMKVPLQEVFLARYHGRCPICRLPECDCKPRKGAPA